MRKQLSKTVLGLIFCLGGPGLAMAMSRPPEPPPPPVVANPTQGQTCNYMSLNTCTLPFPSNQYTVADPASPTGLKIALQGTLFSKPAEEAINNFGSNEVYQNRHGFSAAAPVLFELDSPYAQHSLPEDGGSAFIVFNQTTGQRENIRTGQVDYAARADKFGASVATVVEGYPRSRFTFGHKYVAVLTKDIKPQQGGDYSAVEAVSELASGRASAELSRVYGEAFDYVQTQGIAASRILSLTTFTVIDEYSSNAELYQLIDVVERDDHPVRNLSMSYALVGPIAATVTGQVRLTDLRDPSSGRVRYSAGMQGRPYWTDFILEIPRAARYGKVPVAIYGHGLAADKGSARNSASTPNAMKGVATISIDQPYHGSRIDIDGYSLSTLPTKDNLPRVAGMVAQSSLDLHSVLVALKTSLSGINVVPKNTRWNRMLYPGGINSVDLDLEQILYEGTSLGGVLGSAFASSGRNVKGAFMHVSGVGIANILSHSILFETFKFNEMIPPEATGGDAGLMFHAVQTEIDIADGINFIHYLREGGFGRLPRPTAIQYGLRDQVVFNRSSEAFAEIVDLPLVGVVIEPVAHLRRTLDFEEGNGVVQSLPLIPTGTFADQILGHASFLGLNSRVQMFRWLDIVTD